MRQNARLNGDTRKRLTLCAAELCATLGIELQEEHREEIEKRKAYATKRARQKYEWYIAHREEVIARSSARIKAWRKEHPEEARKKSSEYRERYKNYHKGYYEEHREEALEQAKNYYKAHREEILSKKRARYAKKRKEQTDGENA